MENVAFKVIQAVSILLMVAAVTTANELAKDNNSRFKKGRPLFSPRRVNNMLHGIMNILIVVIIIMFVSIFK